MTAEEEELAQVEEQVRFRERDHHHPDRGPATLGQNLERLVRNLGAPPISVLTRLEQSWPDMVGPALSATTRPIELVDGVLTVGCDDAAWAAQIGWMEGQIKQRFAATFGADLLRRVATKVTG